MRNIERSTGHLTLCPNARENPSRGVIAPRAEGLGPKPSAPRPQAEGASRPEGFAQRALPEGRSRRGEPLKGAKQSPEAVLEMASGAPRPRNDSLE